MIDKKEMYKKLSKVVLRYESLRIAILKIKKRISRLECLCPDLEKGRDCNTRALDYWKEYNNSPSSGYDCWTSFEEEYKIQVGEDAVCKNCQERRFLKKKALIPLNLKMAACKRNITKYAKEIEKKQYGI